MATVSSMPVQRPKKVVRYGKSTTRSTYSTKHVADFLDELDDDTPSVTGIAPSSITTVKETHGVHKRGTENGDKPATLIDKLGADMRLQKSPMRKDIQMPTIDQSARDEAERRSRSKTTVVKSRARKQDAFDVPSSEDAEEAEVPLRHVSPLRVKGRRMLVDDTATRDAQMAPWEKRKAPPKAVVKLDAIAGKKDVSGNARIEPVVAPPAHKANVPVSLPTREVQAHGTSAAARLAARRQLASSNASTSTTQPATATAASNKRTGTSAGSTLSTPRKRARKSPPPEGRSGDIDMGDDLPVFDCDMASGSSGIPSADLDVFDLPDSSNDEATHPKRAAHTAKVAAKSDRRGKLTSTRKLTPTKGSSAPARLMEMLPPDTDSTDAPSRSPSMLTSVPSTPRRSATPARGAQTATSPAQVSSSGSSRARANGTLTPKQKHLWSQLLPSDPIAPSPSALAIKELTLEGQRRTASTASSPARTLTKSKSDVPEMHRRRTRLVDRLKAAASSSEDELSEADSNEEMEDVDVTVRSTVAKQGPIVEDVELLQSQSQSQSQSQAAEPGAKVTYARTRSYLPEDNLEELMFDLPSETPQRPPVLARAPSKTHATSQKSAFDLEESDEEGGSTGRLRTIHELRAAGRNDRFMRETEALVEDIVDHTSSARSRRRSALMELATKLADKAYAERFAAQGFDHKLVAECGTAPDDVADFVLATAFALLLAAEPAEHVIDSFKEADVLAWLAKRLLHTVEIGKLAKDRKSNMSKAAQGTLVEFADMIKSQQSLWDQAKPISMSSRFIALKAIELLVGRLRRSGDRSELLTGEQLQHVMTAHAASATDTSLSISVLESLSTSALGLAWPRDVLERIAGLLPHLEKSSDIAAHTLFLAFRLTLNLTNDNARTCQVFATAEVVRYLLQAVKTSFEKLEEPVLDERAIDLDLLVLAMGVMINLAEHSEAARQCTVNVTSSSTLDALLEIFQQGQKRIEEAESVEESTANVAFGYLAVMLANLCLGENARTHIAATLPGQNLGMLVAAVEEFVMHHQKVDMLSFEGAEGVEVWGAFTARLKGVLARLKAVADNAV